MAYRRSLAAPSWKGNAAIPLTVITGHHAVPLPSALGPTITGKLFTLDESLKLTLTAFLRLLDAPVDDPSWQTLDPAQRACARSTQSSAYFFGKPNNNHFSSSSRICTGLIGRPSVARQPRRWLGIEAGSFCLSIIDPNISTDGPIEPIIARCVLMRCLLRAPRSY